MLTIPYPCLRKLLKDKSLYFRKVLIKKNPGFDAEVKQKSLYNTVFSHDSVDMINIVNDKVSSWSAACHFIGIDIEK